MRIRHAALVIAMAVGSAQAAPLPAARQVEAERWAVRPLPQVNAGKNQTWRPIKAYRPDTSIESLSIVLKAAHATGKTVKAGGSRHSWSPAAATSGVYIHPERMKFVERPAYEDLREAASTDAGLYRVGSGTTIRELNQTLWQTGHSIAALGGYDGQTLGGVLPTGTHGSVLTHGPLVDIVKSVDLVRANGDKVRLEPAGGITDPVKFKRRYPGWKLVQDDDTFHASLVNLGTMGIVHSYVISTTKRFYMNEVRTRGTGRQAQALLRGENIYRVMQSDRAGEKTAFPGHPAGSYHFEVLWNPYTDRTLVTSRTPLDEEAQADLAAHEPKYFDKSLDRDPLRALKTNPKYMRRHLTELTAEYFGNTTAKVMELASAVLPHAVPKLVDLALKGLEDDGYTQRSYNVFNIGDAENKIPAQSATLSLPIAGDKYLQAMDVMRETAARFAKDHREFQTGPISLRFVKGSKAALADPVDVCKFEIIFGGDSKATQALSKKLVDAYYTALYDKFGADVRVHFGQMMPESYVKDGKQRVAESYPQSETFGRVRAKLDPDGTFANPAQRAMLP